MKNIRLLYFFLLLSFFSISAYSVTRYVNDNNPSPASPFDSWTTAATAIQDALDVSSDGDLVLVTNGTYSSGGAALPGHSLVSRICVSNAVTIQSVTGPAHTRIVGAPDPLTGNHGSNAVRCAMLTAGATISGFTLSGGWTFATGNAAIDRAGGGVYFQEGGTVSNCVLAHNSASGNGGAAYIYMDGSIASCQIVSNTSNKGGGIFMRNGFVTGCMIAWNYSGTTGGGIHSRNNGAVEQCTFFRNRTVDDGGGMLCTENASVRYSTFDRNRADGTYGTAGGVILYYGGSMDHCIIVSNYSRYSGGGVAIYAGNGSMNNCLVYRNTCSSYGGGVYCYAGGGPIANCTITENRSLYYYGGVNCNYTGIFYNTIIYYNKANSGADEIGGNHGVAYNSCIPTNGGLATIVACFTNAPQFINRATDNFRLKATSPCIDSGSDSRARGTLDLDNVGRIMGAHVDRGAYEYHFLAPAMPAPAISAPVAVPAGSDGIIGFTNTTSILISGTKSSGIFAVAPWTTNNLSQTLPGSSWSQYITTLPCEIGGAWSIFSYHSVSNDLYTVSTGETTLQIMNYRMLPSVAITSIPTWVTHDISIYAIAGTNNLFVAGTMLWTNRLNKAHGTLPAQAAWSVADIPLTIGNNTIVVRGTNVLGDIHENSVVIIRYPEGTGTPVVDILSAPAWVYYDENKATVAGVNTNIVGKLSWTNNRHTETTNLFNTGFSVQVNNLELGDNWITVFGTNLFGAFASDSVMIMRQTAAQRFALTNYVWLSSPAPTPPYDSWSSAATNIQQALAAASSGLTGTVVVVTNGTYLLQEAVSVTSAVYLSSVNGPDYTILDANRSFTTNRALLIRNSLAVVDGFTISNAYWTPNGGGAFIATAGGTIINCVFINCTAGEKGGGVYLNQAGRVEWCRFINCTAGNWGGGAHLEQGGEIYNSTVSGCYATVFGGGFSLYGGGRLYTCLVTHNYARRGGGVYSRYYPTRLDNCTIVSNSAEIEAGGLYIREGVDMRGSIVYFNTAPTNQNWYKYGTITVQDACTYPHLGSAWVTNEPLFVNAGAGNYHLQVPSPCINKGPVYAWMNTAVDLDGNPRVSSGLVDLGVYEMNTDPRVFITNTPALVAYPVGQSTIAGTNNYWVAGTMWWTNTATEAQAAFGPYTGTTNWLATGIVLAHGDNPISVFGSNAWGYVTSDSIILHRETYQEGIPKIDANTLIFPSSDSMLSVDHSTNITWNPNGITDTIDGTNLTISCISIHRSNDLAEISIPATNMPNCTGWCPWQPPQELIAGMTTYVVRFEVVDSSSLSNSWIFYDHAFIVVPEPTALALLILAGLLFRRMRGAKTLGIALIALCITMPVLQTYASAPIVTNITVQQQALPPENVDIYYDLIDADGDSNYVHVVVSTNSGAFYNVVATNFSGDVGNGIMPGVGKHIIWNAAEDIPFFSSRTVRVKITVDDEMVLIPAGNYDMGDTFNEGYPGELPVHSVFVNAFYMDKYEVTKSKWDEVYTWAVTNGYSFDNVGSGKATNHPVQTIYWFDCVKWCNARSEREGRTPCYYTNATKTNVYKTGWFSIANDCVNWDANGYRLPTEAEWEKAARGGAAGHRFPWTDADTISHSRANYYSFWSGGSPYYPYDVSSTEGYHPDYDDLPEPHTSPVGSFAANGYGLYDMAGNEREWCWDRYDGNYYSSSPASDPRGPPSGPDRVLRGGSWRGQAINSRCAYRGSGTPIYADTRNGFRCVCP